VNSIHVHDDAIEVSTLVWSPSDAAFTLGPAQRFPR
jgi:hypothetical protein